MRRQAAMVVLVTVAVSAGCVEHLLGGCPPMGPFSTSWEDPSLWPRLQVGVDHPDYAGGVIPPPGESVSSPALDDRIGPGLYGLETLFYSPPGAHRFDGGASYREGVVSTQADETVASEAVRATIRSFVLNITQDVEAPELEAWLDTFMASRHDSGGRVADPEQWDRYSEPAGDEWLVVYEYEANLTLATRLPEVLETLAAGGHWSTGSHGLQLEHEALKARLGLAVAYAQGIVEGIAPVNLTVSALGQASYSVDVAAEPAPEQAQAWMNRTFADLGLGPAPTDHRGFRASGYC